MPVVSLNLNFTHTQIDYSAFPQNYIKKFNECNYQII